MRRLVRFLPVAALAITVLVPVTFIAVTAFLSGWQLKPVLTGSMAPSYPRGSLLVVEPISADAVEVGMVVVFEDPQAPGVLIVHRVIERLPQAKPLFKTKGDANLAPDPIPVDATRVRGHVTRSIPALGAAIHEMRWPRNVLVLVVLPAVLLLITEVRARRARRGAPQICIQCLRETAASSPH